MNYAAMRYVAEGCRVQGPGRPILWVLAYRADRHTGDAWASQPRIAAESGVSLPTVKRTLPALIAGGHVAIVMESSGRRSTCYRILSDTSTVPPSGVTGNPQGNGVVVSEGPGSERYRKPVAVSESSRSGITGLHSLDPVAVSESASLYKEGREELEGFEEGAAESSPSAQDADDSAAHSNPTRCRHLNDPSECGVCSNPTPALPPRAALDEILERKDRSP